MSPDMKRLYEVAEKEMAALACVFAAGDGYHIVRAVLTELREVSHASADVAWDKFCWLGPDKCGSTPEPTPEAVVAVIVDQILAEPATA